MPRTAATGPQRWVLWCRTSAMILSAARAAPCPRIAHERVDTGRYVTTPVSTGNRVVPDQSTRNGTRRYQADGPGGFCNHEVASSILAPGSTITADSERVVVGIGELSPWMVVVVDRADVGRPGGPKSIGCLADGRRGRMVRSVCSEDLDADPPPAGGVVADEHQSRPGAGGIDQGVDVGSVLERDPVVPGVVVPAGVPGRGRFCDVTQRTYRTPTRSLRCRT